MADGAVWPTGIPGGEGADEQPAEPEAIRLLAEEADRRLHPVEHRQCVDHGEWWRVLLDQPAYPVNVRPVDRRGTRRAEGRSAPVDRKSTRLNSSHSQISYA